MRAVGMDKAVLLLLLSLLSVPALHALSDDPTEQPVTKGPIVINELLANPNGTLAALQANTSEQITWTTITGVTEWLEIHNQGSAAAADGSTAGGTETDLSGWVVTRGPRGNIKKEKKDNVYQIPQGIRLPAGGFLLILCPNPDEPFPSVPSGSNVLLATGFKVSKKGLYLYDGAGKLQAATGELPDQREGVSFGLSQPASKTPGANPYTFLTSQTPWLANSPGRADIGPFVYKVRHSPEGFVPPGTPIQITAKVRPNQAQIQSAVLQYRVNFGPEKAVAMKVSQSGGSSLGYAGVIPASEFKAGDMVRWAVRSSDTMGGVNQEPMSTGPNTPQYKGTIIPVPAAANSTLPILYWYAQDPATAVTTTGTAASLGFNGSFYDNVDGRRRGMTALSWKKPKIKFQGEEPFEVFPGVPGDKELKLNSYFVELGENSMMKEVVAYKIMKEEGVLAPLSQHIQLYLNGQFYGLYGIVESIDKPMLERFNLPTDGTLYKSLSGELSNLRWDLPIAEMPSYYGVPGEADDADWQLLTNFTRGLAGCGSSPRTSFVYDNLNLPNVINEMAVNTLVNNMDRCTKNFYVYYNPETAEWSRISWDIEASFGQDNLLNGAPGPTYCVLACEQWNSPLYCDSEHPQDIGGIQTAWGEVTAVGMNPYQGSATGRKLSQQAWKSGKLMAEGTKQWTFPRSADWANPDRDQCSTKSVIGARGTFNHLTDAVLDVNSTRMMYMRRLRNLADKYYGGGALKQIVDATRSSIASTAAMDNAIWQRGDGSNGYRQLMSEFIPIRTKQLLQYYAPGGLNPLLPGPQPKSSSMAFKIGPSDLQDSDESKRYMSLQLQEPKGDAVDVSGWKLVKGQEVRWTIPHGTVILPEKPLHLSPSVRSFRGRSEGPKGGEAVFVLQVPQELLAQPGQSSSYVLMDAQGNNVTLET